MGDTIITVVILAIFFGLMSFICDRSYKKVKANKRATAALEKRLGATMSATLKHISGLPIAKGAVVEVYYGPEKIVFKKGGQEISVAREKVTGMELVKSGNTTRKVMSGAATGKYLVGGKAGAAVGALAAMVPILVISYTSNGKSKHITLDLASSGTFGSKVVADFQQTAKPVRSKIEL